MNMRKMGGGVKMLFYDIIKKGFYLFA